MYRISTLNKISPVGLARFDEQYTIADGTESISGSTGVLVRSAAMHDMAFDDELLAIARAGAGVNNIPLDRCADQGIVVFNTPGANANAVKELIVGALIVAARNMDSAMAWVNGLPGTVEDISKAVEKGKSKFAGTEIKGKALGVVGLGAIGAMVANAALGLGMDVCGYDPYLSPAAASRLDPKVKVIEKLEDLLPLCDYVTLHLPAVESTKGMFNASLFSCFKDGAILLNFSRDKLVNEADLLAALESGKLAKYITDFGTEGIIGKPHVTCTPHLGASTEEAEDNCAVMAADEIRDYIENGNIRNSVNFPAVDLGAPAAGEHRVAFLTKGVDDPVKLAIELMGGVAMTSVKGAVRGAYGYALVATSAPVSEIPAAEGVTRVRVIR